jgi:uncharacterized protein YyaL (SSP411 family)
MYVSHKYDESRPKLAEKSMLEKFNNENFDPKTGQPFFKPKICRSPKDKKHRSSKSIGDLLYNNKKKYDENLKKLKEKHESQIVQTANKKSTNKNSEQILEKMKNHRFAEMFHMLDSNGDGLISAQKINISCLHPDVLHIMTPLF